MHGRLKVRTSEEERILKEKERAKKVAQYQAGMAILVEKRTRKEYDEDALEMTAKILASNPDIYTLWNYRREILLFLAQSENAEDISKMYDSELDLTQTCLKANPKSYPSWYQRIWVLDNRSDPDWKKELSLCNVYLKLDERNFHCWDYRRHIVSKLGTEDENEFEFSTEKIFENFSNYSAWHYRSKLLTKLYPDPECIRSVEEKIHRDELELILNAAFTDPNDTSAWFYQRWLLGAMPQPENLAVVRITSGKSYLAFNQPLSCPLSIIDVKVGGHKVDGNWKSVSGHQKDVLWVVDHTETIHLESSSTAMVSLQMDGQIKRQVDCNFCNGELIGYVEASFPNIFGESIVEELQKQVESCEQLLELEPDSKWTYLTLAVIKHSISHMENYESCVDIMKKLMELDPKRRNYYNDLASRWHIEYFLQNSGDLRNIITSPDSIVKLSTLYHLQYWSANTEVHLSNQELTSQCLPKLYVLQNCEVLHLDNNCLDSLRGFPVLPNLKTIHLKGNNISQDEEKYLSGCPNLREIVWN